MQGKKGISYRKRKTGRSSCSDGREGCASGEDKFGWDPMFLSIGQGENKRVRHLAKTKFRWVRTLLSRRWGEGMRARHFASDAKGLQWDLLLERRPAIPPRRPPSVRGSDSNDVLVE